MIELISMHIPKTAGISFQKTLEGVYGKNAVLRVNHFMRNKKNTENYYSVKREDITPEIKVIHGHFIYDELVEWFNIDRNIPVITWVRDPAKRVISAFYYLKQVLNNKLKEANVDEETYKYTKEISVSLLGFAKKPGRRNKMTKYMDKSIINDFLFIGVVENYSEDLKILAEILQWGDYEERWENRSNPNKKEHKKKVPELNKYNKEDLKLYKKVLKLRKKRVLKRNKLLKKSG